MSGDAGTPGSAGSGRTSRWLPRWSLRARLTAITSGLLCVTLAAGALLLTTVISVSRISALDEIVAQRAETVATMISEDRVPQALGVAEPGEIAQVLDAAGSVLATSPNASRTLPLVSAAELAALGGAGRTEGDGELVIATTGESAYDEQARVALLPTSYRDEPVTVVVSMPLGEVQGVLRALRIALIGVVPVLTGLLALAIWLVIGRALHPVSQLRRAASQVAREGGPGALPVPPGQDEIVALARTLNEMLDRLESGAARQRAFVADAAHELRSPLAAVRASLEVAREHPTAYPAAELSADVSGEVLRMQALVDDLLLLARMGSAATPRGEVDLAEVVGEVADAFGAAPHPSTAVALDAVWEEPGTVRGDAMAVSRVVRNLLDNAARHARTRVVVTVGGGSVVVDDDGAGIPSEDRERVFERFVRLDEAREREAGGSGLGLAIAREIAREHGGEITLAASPLGGLRARLELPTA